MSSNNLDKKSVEYLALALRQSTTIPETSEAASAPVLESKASDGGENSDEVEEEQEQNYGPIPHMSLTTMLKDTQADTAENPLALQTLRLDDCNLRAVSIDLLGKTVLAVP